MKNIKSFCFVIILFTLSFVLVFLSGCKKGDIPTVTTADVSNITATGATCGGEVTSDGNDKVTQRGVCWSTTLNPTIENNKTTNGTGTGSFTSTITGLTSNTTYYVRAYAINENGTGYGELKQFVTARTSGITLSTVHISAGTFLMGSPVTETGRDQDETQFSVTLSAFTMSKYEITTAQFAEFLNENNIGIDGLMTDGSYPNQPVLDVYSCFLSYNNEVWTPVSGYENKPMVGVTWYGATEFAAYAGGRLPTEAEWEYACRATTTTPFNTGECLTNDDANYLWSSPYSTCQNSSITSPNSIQTVGSYSPNTWGLYDMHGNVYEWCSDWCNTYPTTAQTNPTGPTSGVYKVVRGGSYQMGAVNCRSADRGSYIPEQGSAQIGFRVVIP